MEKCRLKNDGKIKFNKNDGKIKPTKS